MYSTFQQQPASLSPSYDNSNYSLVNSEHKEPKRVEKHDLGPGNVQKELGYLTSYRFRQKDVQKIPICEPISPDSIMLNSGHAVKHNQNQDDYPDFNIPPKVVPMVPIEKVVEKKFYLGTKKGKVHVITNTVVDMQ